MIINLGIQVLPVQSSQKAYDIVDECIACIQQSGVKYQVTPFETILEGEYEEVMHVFHQVFGLANTLSPETVIQARLHSKRDMDVSAKEKTAKFKEEHP